MHLPSEALLNDVRAAFSHGLDVLLAVCAGLAGSAPYSRWPSCPAGPEQAAAPQRP